MNFSLCANMSGFAQTVGFIDHIYIHTYILLYHDMMGVRILFCSHRPTHVPLL